MFFSVWLWRKGVLLIRSPSNRGLLGRRSTRSGLVAALRRKY